MHFSLITQNSKHKTTPNCNCSKHQMCFHDSKMNQLNRFKKFFNKKYSLKQRLSTHQSFLQGYCRPCSTQYEKSLSLAQQSSLKKTFKMVQRESVNLSKNSKTKINQRNARCCNSTKINTKFQMTKRERKIKYMKQLSVQKIKIKPNKIRINGNCELKQLNLKFQKFIHFRSHYLHSSASKTSLNSEQINISPRKPKSSTVDLKQYSKCITMKTQIAKQKLNTFQEARYKNFQNINVFLPQIASINRSQSPIRGWNVGRESVNQLCIQKIKQQKNKGSQRKKSRRLTRLNEEKRIV